MTESLYTRAKLVLLELDELPAEERADRAATLCADDAELRAEVLSLLEHVDAPDERVSTESYVRQLIDGLAGEGNGLAEAPILEGPLKPGARIGAFTLGERLGAGGMGVVYEAEQDEPRRTVALKILAGGAASKELLARFRQEVHVLGRLDHSGIAALYEAGGLRTDDGLRPFFAMQLVRGVPLTHWAREHKPSVERIVELLAEVCEAVAHAHAKGVVHRDIKPANILVDAEGHPTVLDFGVARLTDAHTQLSSLHTEPGAVLGTLPYMSPEQVSGDVDSIDARTDVYALGALLFEALTDELPLQVDDLTLPAAALVIQRKDPRRLTSLDTRLPRDLDVLVDKALAKEPERRYADATALGADLRRFLGGRTLVARPLSPAEQLGRLARRHKAITAGLIIAVVSLATTLGVSLYQTGVARDASRDAVRETNRTRLIAAAAALDAEEPRATALQLQAVLPEHRGWEWHHLWQRLHPEALLLTDVPELAAVALSPTPGEFTELSHRGGVRRRALLDGAPRSELRLAGDFETLDRAQLSADGSRCAAALSGNAPRVALWDTSSGRRLQEFAIRGQLEHLALSDDGRSLGWIADSTAYLWSEADPTAVERELPRKNYNATRPVVTAPLMVTGGAFGTFSLIELRSASGGLSRNIKHARGTRTSALAVSPEAGLVAVVAQDGAIQLHATEFEQKEVLGTLSGHRNAVTQLRFFAQGTRLLSVGQDQTLRLWDVNAREELALWPVLDPALASLHVDPEGRFAIGQTTSNNVVGWDLSHTPDADVLIGHERYVYDVDTGPDGQVVSGSWGGSVRWWDARDGRPRRAESFHDTRVEHVLVSPDGRRVAARADRQLMIFESNPTQPPRILPGTFFTTSALAWLADGEQLLVGPAQARSDTIKHLRLFDATSGKLVETVPLDEKIVRALAISPDQTLLATGTSKGALSLLRWPGGEVVARLPPHSSEATQVAFSPDGERLLSTSTDGSVRVWSVDDRRLALELSGHPGEVWDAAWSPDGTRIATACHDGIVRLFDTDDGALVMQLRGHTDYVHGLAFTPDGSTLVTGSGDRTVRLWHTVPLRERLVGAAARGTEGAGSGR